MDYDGLDGLNCHFLRVAADGMDYGSKLLIVISSGSPPNFGLELAIQSIQSIPVHPQSIPMYRQSILVHPSQSRPILSNTSQTSQSYSILANLDEF